MPVVRFTAVQTDLCTSYTLQKKIRRKKLLTNNAELPVLNGLHVMFALYM
jgi:hypothetical protein